MIKDADIVKMVLDKIQFQWKTIKKSFHDFSKDNKGFLMPEELQFYLKHWGIHIDEETFNHVYE